jgi:hypothetical protein
MTRPRRALLPLTFTLVTVCLLIGCSRSYEDVAGEKIAGQVVAAQAELSIKMQQELRRTDFPGNAERLTDLEELVAIDVRAASGMSGFFARTETSTAMTLEMIAFGEANSGGITNNDHRFYTCYQLVGTFGSPDVTRQTATCQDWVVELAPVDAELLPFDQIRFPEE